MGRLDMKKIDFQHFRMFTSITHEETVEEDARKQLADLIYKNMNGIQALNLALKILNSEGEIELSAEEMSLLIPFIENGFTPMFIESFNANLK